MVTDIIPSHFGIGNMPTDDGDGLNNIRLRVGEVQAVYGKRHPLNVSKKRTEYSVFVAHRANGTAVTKIYEHCFLKDELGGRADFFRFVLRGDQSARRRQIGPGVGSKVALMCVNGESSNPMILCGLPDSNTETEADNDTEAGEAILGLHFRYNGIDIVINEDGELKLSYLGAQKDDGTPAEGVDDKAVGTTVSITKDGNLTVSDKEAKNVILLDHANNKIKITTPEYDVVADKIKHGSDGSSEPHMLGNAWKTWMSNVLSAIGHITVATASGPSSVPLNIPEFEGLRAQLETLLSKKAFTE